MQASRATRVLHVAAVQDTVLHLLLPQLTALQEVGYDVRVAVAADDHGMFETDLTRFRPLDVRFTRRMRPLEIVAGLRSYLWALRSWTPDIVHMHTPAVAFPARLIPRRMLPAATSVVYTVHGFAHVWDQRKLSDVLLERVERSLAPATDLLLFQSREDLAHARRLGYRAELLFLGNGVQPEWFQASRSRRKVGQVQALFIGRLVRGKGIRELLAAAAEVPEVELSVAGAELPSDRAGVGAEVRRRCQEQGLRGRVHLLGSLTAEQLRRRIVAADVIVLPSHREGVPRSIIEGMAMGRPAIVTNIRGCRELIRHGHEGYLVPRGDAAALAACLRTFAGLKDHTYLAMCASATARAAELYREELVVRRLLAAYEGLGHPAHHKNGPQQ